jgi:hypothetical protein
MCHFSSRDHLTASGLIFALITGFSWCVIRQIAKLMPGGRHYEDYRMFIKQKVSPTGYCLQN